VAHSIHHDDGHFERLDARFPQIYDRLFWGNNLPSMTPPDRCFHPEWSPDDLAALAEVLWAGLEMFQTRIRQVQ
jgi:hypothetical protein